MNFRRATRGRKRSPSAGDPQALNRYSYVANNPLRYTDPTGRFVVWSVDAFWGTPMSWGPALISKLISVGGIVKEIVDGILVPINNCITAAELVGGGAAIAAAGYAVGESWVELAGWALVAYGIHLAQRNHCLPKV